MRKKAKLKLTNNSELRNFFHRTFKDLKKYEQTQTDERTIINFMWHGYPFGFLISIKDGEIKESSGDPSAILVIQKQLEIDTLKKKLNENKNN